MDRWFGARRKSPIEGLAAGTSFYYIITDRGFGRWIEGLGRPENHRSRDREFRVPRQSPIEGLVGASRVYGAKKISDRDFGWRVKG